MIHDWFWCKVLEGACITQDHRWQGWPIPSPSEPLSYSPLFAPPTLSLQPFPVLGLVVLPSVPLWSLKFLRAGRQKPVFLPCWRFAVTSVYVCFLVVSVECYCLTMAYCEKEKKKTTVLCREFFKIRHFAVLHNINTKPETKQVRINRSVMIKTQIMQQHNCPGCLQSSATSSVVGYCS